MKMSLLRDLKHKMLGGQRGTKKGFKEDGPVTWVIAGLGNPDAQYKNTRHNVGWSVIDVMSKKYGIKVEHEAFKGLIGRGEIAGEPVLLVKPLTYMNNSGECVKPICDYYKIEPDHVLAIFDDISLEPGNLRIRKKGSAGGHNGVKSLIACLGNQDFPRIKVGVGAPEGDLIEHVLGKFHGEDVELVRESMERAAKAAETVIAKGTDKAMNEFNQKKNK